MCGIFGFAGYPFGRETCQRAVASLQHRGPDATGFWFAAGDSAGLGHARLSVLDLTDAGRQPMHSEDGLVHLVANGEIYNHQELRHALRATGHRFVSASDSEVILHGYEEWGANVCERLAGMFAFAVYAEKDKTLFLARDRIGIKPLYYWHQENIFAFASELKALATMPEFRCGLDRTALEHYLTFGYIPAPLSIYENTFKLLPGHWLRWQNGKTEVQAYWQLPTAQSDAHVMTESEAVDRLEALLKESVRHRLMSDVPLGAFLSGGIDSSLICALARSVMNRPLKTFTIGFDFAQYDESTNAEAVAKHLGTDHTTVTMTERDLLEIVPKIPSLYDEPFADSSALPTYLLSAITRREVTVALSGDGGDELFFGYTRYLDYLKLAYLEWLPRALRRGCGRLLHRLLGESPLGRLGKALSYREFDEGTLLFAGIFHRLRFDRLLGHPFDLNTCRYHEAYRRLQHLPRAQIGPLLDQQFYLPDDILCKVDRASMAHALEVRVPFLDHTVVEFANTLPPSLKYCRGEQKYLTKKLLARHVPRRFWDRPKQGFSIPLDHWLRGPLRPLVEDLLNPERLKHQGLFSPSFVQELIQEHMRGLKDNQHYLWTLLVFEMWLEAQGM